MSLDVMSKKVKAVLLRRTGKAFSIHMFRHSCATFIADMAPERARIAAGVLHHRKFKTTAKHYIRGQQRRAFAKYHEGVKQVMRNGARKRRPKE